MAQKTKTNQNDWTNKKHQWDIKSHTIGKDNNIEKMFLEWKKVAFKTARATRILYKTKKDFINWLHLDQQEQKLYSRIDLFLSEKQREHPKATKWKSYRTKIKKVLVKVDKLVDYSTSYIINSHQKTIKRYLNCNELKEYKRLIETKYFSVKGHSITQINNLIRSKIQANAELDILKQAIEEDTFKYKPYIFDENNKRIEANSYWDFMESKNEFIRKKGWLNYWHQYDDMKNSYGVLMYLINYRSNQEMRMFHYKSDLEHDIITSYELKMEQFEKIIDYGSAYKYLHIRFKDHLAGIINYTFGLKQYNPWDLALVDKLFDRIKFSPEQATQMIIEAAKPFGKEYEDAVKWIFKRKLIQWNGKVRKYSNVTFVLDGNLKSEPISIRYNGTLTSVAVLSHEIGHSVASYLSKKHQKTYRVINDVNCEIPSCVSQTVLLLTIANNKKYSKELRQAAIWYILDYFFKAVSCYAAQVHFKIRANKLFDKEGKLDILELLRGNFINRTDYEGITKYEKQWIDAPYTKLTRYEFLPSYIDDFDSNIGIKYYIGQIIGSVVGANIHLGNKKVLDMYFKFLFNGGKKRPLEAIKILGLDMLKPDVYGMAKGFILDMLKIFESYPTLNKPGSLRYGNDNNFTKRYKRIK